MHIEVCFKKLPSVSPSRPKLSEENTELSSANSQLTLVISDRETSSLIIQRRATARCMTAIGLGNLLQLFPQIPFRLSAVKKRIKTINIRVSIHTDFY